MTAYDAGADGFTLSSDSSLLSESSIRLIRNTDAVDDSPVGQTTLPNATATFFDSDGVSLKTSVMRAAPLPPNSSASNCPEAVKSRSRTCFRPTMSFSVSCFLSSASFGDSLSPSADFLIGDRDTRPLDFFPSRFSSTYNFCANGDVFCRRTSYMPVRSLCGCGECSKRSPATHVSTTFVFRSKTSPSVMTKLASLPGSTVPSWSARPNRVAGVSVRAFSAESLASPLVTALRSCLRKSLVDDNLSVVKAKVIPAAATRAGFSGAMSQCSNDSRVTFSAASAVLTLGGREKFRGRITKRLVAAISSSRRYSCPLPRTIRFSPNSLANRSARRKNSSFDVSTTIGCWPLKADCSAFRASLRSGRGSSG